MEYDFIKDLNFILEALDTTTSKLASDLGVSRGYIESLLGETSKPNPQIMESIYDYAYKNGIRINLSVEEVLKESSTNKVLFHGSKAGLSTIKINGSRDDCDFGNGFYLGESFYQAASFVSDTKCGSVYAFALDDKNLKTVDFRANEDWMLLICFFRGKIKKYADHPKIKSLLESIKGADIIKAPIANNKMFQVMRLFEDGEITSEEALHALSASNLGDQIVLKSEKAISSLIPLARFYICQQEKNHYEGSNKERGLTIDTKLKLAKREFRGKGKYIEELFE